MILEKMDGMFEEIECKSFLLYKIKLGRRFIFKNLWISVKFGERSSYV